MIALTKLNRANWHSVDECTVGAFQVNDLNLVVRNLDHRVLPRDFIIPQPNFVGLFATNGK